MQLYGSMHDARCPGNCCRVTWRARARPRVLSAGPLANHSLASPMCNRHSTQVRGALSEAAQLAPCLGYGSSQDVMANARAAQDPNWLSCVFGLTVAPPPGYELPPIPSRCSP